MPICQKNIISTFGRGWRVVFLCTIATFAVNASAQTYECVDGKGNSRYSPTACATHENERDLRKIRRIGGEKKAQSANEYFEEERARKDRERETAARAQEERQREKDLIRLEREMRYDAAAEILNKLRVEKEAGKPASRP